MVFGGVLGHAQDLAVMLDAAWRLRRIAGIHFAIVGDGPAKGLAQDMALARGLRNVTFLPPMPPDEYAGFVTDEADCGLVTLKPRVSSIPSKIGTFLALGVPIAAALPDGDAADLVAASGAGVRVAAGDDEGLAVTVAGFASCPDVLHQLAENGRAFAKTVLSRERALDAWDVLLRGLA